MKTSDAYLFINKDNIIYRYFISIKINNYMYESLWNFIVTIVRKYTYTKTYKYSRLWITVNKVNEHIKYNKQNLGANITGFNTFILSKGLLQEKE